MPYLANPATLWLWLSIPGFLAWYILWYDKRRLFIPLSHDPEKLAGKKRISTILRYLPMSLQLLGLVLAIYALARPQLAHESMKIFSEGIDIMLLMDTSGSMETEDFEPNRLSVAKEKAITFIEGRKEDRIGIVLFAEDAFSFAPLTLDYALLKKQVESIRPNIMPKDGTAMGSAIAIGVNRLAQSQSPSKVMILLTDGSNNRGQLEPQMAARLARERNIRIYAIGIGKEEFTYQDKNGRFRTVKSDLDEPTLKEIAELTGGTFFRSTDNQDLEQIFNQISAMEKVEIIEETQKEITDLYPIFLICAALALMVAWVLMFFNFYNPLEA